MASGLTGALQAVQSALASANVDFMVIGGFAVVARGVLRTTRDLDLTVEGPCLAAGSLLPALEEHGVVPRIPDALTFARKTQVLLLLHESTGMEVDITMAWAPFELEALARAELLELAGVHVPVATAEDLVVYKLVGARPVDLADIEALVDLHGSSMDLVRLRTLAEAVGEALDDPGRPAMLDAILKGRDSSAP